MNEAETHLPRRLSSIVLAAVVTAVAMLLLDLTWLGVVGREIYDSALGPLKRDEVFWPAAALFYTLYVAAVVTYAVIGARSWRSAVCRGAGLGLVAYGTYDLTNWAIIRSWPALLVPVDLGWGVILTTAAAFLGRLAYDRFEPR
jgi:uncharacterized membrane protein